MRGRRAGSGHPAHAQAFTERLRAELAAGLAECREGRAEQRRAAAGGRPAGGPEPGAGEGGGAEPGAAAPLPGEGRAAGAAGGQGSAPPWPCMTAGSTGPQCTSQWVLVGPQACASLWYCHSISPLQRKKCTPAPNALPASGTVGRGWCLPSASSGSSGRQASAPPGPRTAAVRTCSAGLLLSSGGGRLRCFHCYR